MLQGTIPPVAPHEAVMTQLEGGGGGGGGTFVENFERSCGENYQSIRRAQLQTYGWKKIGLQNAAKPMKLSADI